MRDKKHIQEEVEKTLTSLDHLQRAEANPYLFTRIKARLQKSDKSFWGTASGFIGRPAVAIAAILIVIFINIAVYFQSDSEQTGKDQALAGGQDEEQVFASDYNLSNATIYDVNIDQ